MDQVEEIKQKVDMVELVSEYVPLKRAGRNFKGLCPFHGEKTPSFMVNPELQIYKCFGCGEGGDAYSFLQKMEGMDFGEALRALADRVGVKLTSYRPSEGEETRDRLMKINELAGRAYHFLLTQHKAGKEALQYLKKRGITDEAIEVFKLGYVPGEWEFLGKFLVRKKKHTIDDLRRAGLVVEGRGYDRVRDRIMFPLTNARGQVVGFAGRVLPSDGPSASSGQASKYINSPETEIYHKSELLYGFDVTRGEIKKAGWVVVVEGELDMIASWQAGVKNVVAIKGSALTERQVEWLMRVSERVIMALDADLAGNIAARRGIELAEKAGLFVETVDWARADVGAKDVSDVATTDPEKWLEMVAEPISIYSFYINSAVSRHGLTAEGKTKVSREVLPFLSMIGDEVRKDEYVKELANKIGAEVETVRREMGKISNDKFLIYEPTVRSTRKQLPNDSITKKSRREVLEGYVVGLAMSGKKWEKLGKAVNLFGEGFWNKAAQELVEKQDVRGLPAELVARVGELVFSDQEWSDKEWEKATRELEEIGVREKIGGATGKELVKLTARLSELTKNK